MIWWTSPGAIKALWAHFLSQSHLPITYSWCQVFLYSPSVHIAVGGIQGGRCWDGTGGCWDSLGHCGDAEGTAGGHGARVTIDLLWRGERSSHNVWWICNRKGHLRILGSAVAHMAWWTIPCNLYLYINSKSLALSSGNPICMCAQTASRQSAYTPIQILFLIILSFCKYPLFKGFQIYSFLLSFSKINSITWSYTPKKVPGWIIFYNIFHKICSYKNCIIIFFTVLKYCIQCNNFCLFEYR